MAERRMFAKTIIDSDSFLDMPASSQLLYFHLNMRADDEGFVNNPKKIQRMIGTSDDDLKMLIAKAFVIPFESGIVVIKHWKIHNYIRKDRFQPTKYEEEKEQLSTKENGTYTLVSKMDTDGIPLVAKMDTDGIPLVAKMDTEVRLGKVRLGKVRLGKVSYAEYVLMTEDEHQKLVDKYGEEGTARMIDILDNYIGSKGKNPYKNHYRAILSWVVGRYEEEQAKAQRLKPMDKTEQTKKSFDEVRQRVANGEFNL